MGEGRFFDASFLVRWFCADALAVVFYGCGIQTTISQTRSYRIDEFKENLQRRQYMVEGKIRRSVRLIFVFKGVYKSIG